MVKGLLLARLHAANTGSYFQPSSGVLDRAKPVKTPMMLDGSQQGSLGPVTFTASSGNLLLKLVLRHMLSSSFALVFDLSVYVLIRSSKGDLSNEGSASNTTFRVHVFWSDVLFCCQFTDWVLVPEISISMTQSAVRADNLLRLKTGTVWAANCHVEAQKRQD